MEQASIATKHANDLHTFDSLKAKAWQELLDRQEARLMKRNGSVHLYSLLAWERIALEKHLEKMKLDLQQRHQHELEEYQKTQQFGTCGNES